MKGLSKIFSKCPGDIRKRKSREKNGHLLLCSSLDEILNLKLIYNFTDTYTSISGQ